jgi:hypothetical protein
MNVKIIKNSVTFFLLTLVSCLSNQTELEARQWKPNPLTKKEIQYIEELKTKGFDSIVIESQKIGLNAYGLSDYNIYFRSKIKTAKLNADSIRDVNFQIAKELYDHVIEDSIIYDCNFINISHKVVNGQKYWSRDFYFKYKKKQLEKELKFKVIKNKQGNFERIPI